MSNCLAEKATKKMFEPVAYIKYDEAVREIANVIKTDGVYFHFSLEHTVKVPVMVAISKIMVRGIALKNPVSNRE